MKCLFTYVFLISFMGLQVVTAQEATPSVSSETVIERCITRPTEPADEWRFDGTIITYRQGDGIHAFRDDTPSRYYLAFDNDSEYGESGALSPDGRWLATYLGRKEFEYSWMFNSSFYVTAIRVVSTRPDRETYTIPFDSYQYTQSAHFPHVLWLDNTQFASFSDGNGLDRHWFVVNPFTGTLVEASESQYLPFSEAYSSQPGIYQSANQRSVLSADQMQVVDDLPPAFLAVGDQKERASLHVIDPQTRQIYDTCIETNYSFAVSSDENQVAVSLGREDGFVYIVDLNDWAA